MNETLQVIGGRRSIRAYSPEQIPGADLQKIMEAALLAPSAMNQQKWHFTVVQNKAMLDKMVGTIKENIMNSGHEFLMQRAGVPGYHTFYNAPTVILISAEENADWVQIDCGLAAQNITLAAESLNIGSCVIGSSRLLFASEKSQDFKRELGIPEGYGHICSVALGYRAGESPGAPPRNKDVINYIK